MSQDSNYNDIIQDAARTLGYLSVARKLNQGKKNSRRTQNIHAAISEGILLLNLIENKILSDQSIEDITRSTALKYCYEITRNIIRIVGKEKVKRMVDEFKRREISTIPTSLSQI